MEKRKNNRKTKIGVVTKNKMYKTAVITTTSLVKSPLYKKYIRKRKNFEVHDEGNLCQVGDKVLIIETHPLSSEKRWKVKEILEKARTT